MTKKADTFHIALIMCQLNTITSLLANEYENQDTGWKVGDFKSLNSRQQKPSIDEQFIWTDFTNHGEKSE